MPRESARAEIQTERRQHGRLEILWWGEVEIQSERLGCSVFDLSAGGAKLRIKDTDPAALSGRDLVLALPPFGRFAAQVQWTASPLLGIRFAAADQPRMARVIASGIGALPV